LILHESNIFHYTNFIDFFYPYLFQLANNLNGH